MSPRTFGAGLWPLTIVSDRAISSGYLLFGRVVFGLGPPSADVRNDRVTDGADDKRIGFAMANCLCFRGKDA